MYFEAMEPGVILVSVEEVVLDFGVVIVVRGTPTLFRVEGVVLPGVTRELDIPGVTRPVEYAGVTRPDVAGVTLPLIDGVVRPLRVEATEDGRDTMPLRTAGGDNLLEATKTPQFGGQEKYCMLKVPLESVHMNQLERQLTRQHCHCSCPSQQNLH